MKRKWQVFGIVIVVGAAIIIATAYKPHKNTVPATSTPITGFDPLNATYLINGDPVTLVNGKAATPAAPGSATQVTTTVFGAPTSGDLNGDGAPDAAVMLVQDTGGSGTFYYVAAAIDTANGAEGTAAYFLGDRIAPQTMTIKNSEIVANYAVRKPDDPMTTPPSVGITTYLVLQGSTLVPSAPMVGAGGHCGGNMMTASVCMQGYHCAPAQGSHLPPGDAGGTCMKD